MVGTCSNMLMVWFDLPDTWKTHGSILWGFRQDWCSDCRTCFLVVTKDYQEVWISTRFWAAPRIAAEVPHVVAGKQRPDNRDESVGWRGGFHWGRAGGMPGAERGWHQAGNLMPGAIPSSASWHPPFVSLDFHPLNSWHMSKETRCLTKG